MCNLTSAAWPHNTQICVVYLNRVLNVKALVGAFNQEKALVGEIDGSFTALVRSGTS